MSFDLHRLSRTQGNGNRICLLLFYLAGALLAWLEPVVTARLDGLPAPLPILFLLPVLLAGCVFGGMMIPVVTLLYGVFSMHILSAADSGELLAPVFWRQTAGPLLLSAPLLFLSCETGMRLADLAACELSSGGASARAAVRSRQALHLAGVFGALLFWRWLQ